MKINIKKDLCVGCSLCVQVCPDVYKMENDKAEIKTEDISSELKECAIEGAEQCPVDAIEIEK